MLNGSEVQECPTAVSTKGRDSADGGHREQEPPATAPSFAPSERGPLRRFAESRFCTELAGLTCGTAKRRAW